MKKIFFIGLVLPVLACNNISNNNSTKTISKDSVKKNSKDSVLVTHKGTSVINIHLKSFMVTLKPIFGYRFSIKGDFDGDGKQETLTEHYVSGLDNKETCKFYSNLDYDQTIELAEQKEPLSYFSSSTNKVDSLFISSTSQLFGLALLHNEGDLDGNGTDEISYVIDYADWSNLNSCHIMTFTKSGWNELLKFDIHESNIPEAPETSASYGLFGVDGIQHYENNDTLNRQLEEQLKKFSYIRKVKKNVIEVYEMSMEDKDSVDMGDDYLKIIRLKK